MKRAGPSSGQLSTNLQKTMELAVQHHNGGDLGKAESIYQQVLQTDPNHPDALHLLGVVSHQAGNNDCAVDLFSKALAIKPDFAEAHNNLGNALQDLGKPHEAIEKYHNALAINPQYVEAYTNLGNVLKGLVRLDEAVASYQRALAIKPDYAEAHNNLGNAQKDLGNMNDAVASFHKAISIRPDYADAYWNRGLARLLTGDLLGGFEDYEWRWQLPEYTPRHRNIPLWEGQSLVGKSILVYSEQGYGDTIQFIRYVPMLADQGARVLLEIDEPLKRLLERVDGVEQVIVSSVSPVSASFRIPIMSLPHRFNTTLDLIPANVPYLPLPTATATNIGPVAETIIGIAWAGRPTHKNDSNRSLEFASLKPLLDLTNFSWISLQIDDHHSEAALVAKGSLRDIRDQIHDFADTATAIVAMDLVITVDTAVAHLAGALGKPVWILLPFAPDWRWLLERNDSPWYPTVNLFRQKTPGDWEGVINRVVEALLLSDYS